MARTILARRTWDQGKESLWAAACNASASRRAIINRSGRRPRIGRPSHAVGADRQHRRPLEFIARVVSGDTSQGNLEDFPNVAFGRRRSQQSFAQPFAILFRPVGYEEPL